MQKQKEKYAVKNRPKVYVASRYAGDIEKNVCPNGESAEQVNERALRAVDGLLARGEDAVCVIHGGVIGGLMGLWFPGGNRYTWTPLPGCGWQIEFEAGKPAAYRKVPCAWETET